MDITKMTIDEKIELAKTLLESFGDDSLKKEKKEYIDQIRKDESDSKSLKFERGQTITMEEALKQLEEKHPEAELDEDEEIIWEWPETPFAEKRKSELTDDIDAQVLMEEIEAGWKMKKDLEALAEAEFLIKKEEERIEQIRKSLEDAE